MKFIRPERGLDAFTSLDTAARLPGRLRSWRTLRLAGPTPACRAGRASADTPGSRLPTPDSRLRFPVPDSRFPTLSRPSSSAG